MRLSKQIGMLAILCMMLAVLAGCDLHKHSYTEADCTAPARCEICGLTEGEALGHDASEATCTEASVCSRCNMVVEDALGHNYAKATCTESAACTRCEIVVQEATGHDFSDATCTQAKMCNLCGITEGDALGHDYREAGCVTPSTCSRCDATIGESKGHVLGEATCTTPATCQDCGASQGEALGHRYAFPENAACADHLVCSRCEQESGTVLGHLMVDATCEIPQYCARCGLQGEPALGHDYASATCTTPEICKRCEKFNGTPLGHTYQAATCTQPKTCKVCATQTGDPLDHSYANGFCIRCDLPDPELQFENLYVIDKDYYNGVKKNFTDTYGNTYDIAYEYYSTAYTLTHELPLLYSIHNLNGKYESFSGTFVAGKNMNETIIINIRVDGELVFSKKDVTRTTGKVSFNIDVTGASVIEIRIGSNERFYSNDGVHLALVETKLTKLDVSQANVTRSLPKQNSYTQVAYVDVRKTAIAAPVVVVSELDYKAIYLE